MTPQEKRLMNEIRTKVRKMGAKCYSPNCQSQAIRSHIQQAEGPLRLIAPSGKVHQMDYLFNYDTLTYEYKFRECGIREGDVLTFRGFCNSCDNRIFQIIENGNYDLYSYECQLLHGYRGLVNEKYKVDFNLKAANLALTDPRFSSEAVKFYKQFKDLSEIKVRCLNYHKAEFESDIERGTRHFKFLTLKLPKSEICTSTVFWRLSHLRVSPSALSGILERDSIPSPEPLETIALIPTENELFCILGQEQSPRLKPKISLEEISNYTDREIMVFISSILLRDVESWCISVDWFNRMEAKKSNLEIQKLMNLYRPAQMKSRPINFNLFECG